MMWFPNSTGHLWKQTDSGSFQRHAAEKGIMLAVIAGKLDPAHPRVAACKLLYHLPCNIGAAVINKYDFETDTDGRQRILEAPVQFRKYLGGPVNRNDDGKGVLHR